MRGFSLPHVAGMDVAGVVVAHGAGVGDAAPPIGTAVLVDPVSTCGVCDRCTAGLEPYCENLRTIGSTRQGGFAELVATPAAELSRDPRRDELRRGGLHPGRLHDRVARARHRRSGAARRDRARQRRRLGRVDRDRAVRRRRRRHGDRHGRRPGQGRQGARPRVHARDRPLRRRPTSPRRCSRSPAVAASTSSSTTSARRCSTRRSGRCRSTGGWCSAARRPAPRSRSICRRSTTGVAR